MEGEIRTAVFEEKMVQVCCGEILDTRYQFQAGVDMHGKARATCTLWVWDRALKEWQTGLIAVEKVPADVLGTALSELLQLLRYNRT
ncbi:MAG: hypothetical protein ABIH46_04785 [Chloroflexota bacterium]